MNYTILLYYFFTDISDVDSYRLEHFNYCQSLGLKGRVILSQEGINGTTTGTQSACTQYMEYLQSDMRFKGIEFKIAESDLPAFARLSVKVKPEIVNLGRPDLKPHLRTAPHLSPEDFYNRMNQENTVVVDMRSEYEFKLGKFKNAVTLNMNNFRELPDLVHELEPYKDKTILTYCTGGVRCEKASALLLEQGFKNVYQLNGGILEYSRLTGGKDFEGKCYVFDRRLAVDVNFQNPKVISHCTICDVLSERIVNCANPDCNKHLVICDSCGIKYEGACSETCKQSTGKRPYNPEGYYARETNR